MIRKILVALAWTAGGLIGLCVLLYLVVVAINWRDADPSSAAIRMAELHDNRPAVRDEDNACVYAMGFGVAPGESPLEMGLKRIEWLRQFEGTAKLDLSADPLGERPNHWAALHPALRAYFENCWPDGENCSATLDAAIRKKDEWAISEKWLLDRYGTLLELTGWREYVPLHIAPPLPYQLVMSGQKLLLLRARVHAAKHDAAGVRELLGEDLRFWRRVLESSDLLLNKMIATGALNRHFKQGTEVLRALPPERVSEALPVEWQAPITDAERSMRRCIVGEWQFASGFVRHLTAPDFADVIFTEASTLAKAFATLYAPLFQPQDTINRYAELYSRASALLEGVPLAGYEAATKRASELSRAASRESFPLLSPYNFVGQMLIGTGVADFGEYARRVGDIEGVRQAALAAVRLHEARMLPDDIPAALAASPLRNPYNDQPFAWDAADGAILFRGLEPGERGEHRIH